jgi:Fe2+ or Zn2+ uptake regulation protein
MNEKHDYTLYHVYVIICSECNEEITRSQCGEEPMTRQAAKEMIAEHESVWHGNHPTRLISG